MIVRRLLWVNLVFAVGGCVGGYAPALDSPDPGARIRAIRQVVEKDDRSAIPLLVDRLEDEDEAVRFYAIHALETMTGKDLGYAYYESRQGRQAAVERWRRYVRDRGSRTASSRAAASHESGR